MVMTQQFGYVLAARRADKSVSASLQALRSKATLHDASYYGVIELYGLPQVILEALQLVSDPNGSDFHGLRFLAGAEEGASMLYHEGQFPHGAIAPVTFMWRPLKKDYENGEFKLHDEWQSAKRQLWLWVHPAAYMEAATAIASACQAVVGEEEEGIEMHDRRGQVCRLKLRGKLADELMKKLASGEDVTACGDGDMQESESSDHEDGFDAKEVVASASILNRRALLRVVATAGKKTDQEKKDTVYSVAVRDPRYARCEDGKLTHPLPLEKDLSLLNEPPASEVAQVGTKAIESPLSGLDLSSLGKNAEEPESDRIIKEMQALLDWTDGASTVSSGEYYPSAVPRIDQMDAAEDEGGMDIESLPSSLLWSLSRRRKLQNKFMKDHQLNEEDEQAKKPKSKRFNYEKHGVLSPFQPLWESLFDPQIHQDSTDGEAVQTPCVLRGETYMKPFCFYTSRSTKDDNGTPPPQLNFESIVPVPMPTLVRVVVVVPKRGNIDVNAMVRKGFSCSADSIGTNELHSQLIAPSAEDQARFCNESNWGGDDAGWGKKKQVADEVRG
ncbi:unnamed protein product [Phytophthora lilii]|uniref:Unnamed protein product n=1 Tax=Phytophthora lilii TaxID=2077276 RepID=A0A9W6YIP0_9STRA|nr:unnamed protein product [Phytophthora lilii]